jgi:uncharacterized protein YjiS (DUF1127 family)
MSNRIRTLSAPRAGRVPASAGLVRLLDTIQVWLRRHEDRSRLAGLSDHLVRDIGLSRADVENEASKPFWRA